jgi:DNA-binding response OmpR family regulator
MNRNLKLGDVRVMLADARSHIRSTMKTALAHAGLDNVDHTGTIDVVAESMDDGLGPDILICDMGMRDGETCDLVQAVRQHQIGKNPFLCIIGITWNPTEAEVQKVIDSGIDLLVAAPMSPKRILDRLEALVYNRPPFIITNDYVGPDRRKEPDREQTLPLVSVPNTLRAKALGLWDPNTMRYEVECAVQRVNAAKIERQAEDIACIADMIFELVNNADHMPARPQIARLNDLVNTLADRAEQRGFTQISELCQASVSVVRKMLVTDTPPAATDIELLKQLSLAIRKAMRPDDDETSIVHDIARTVIGAR